MNIEKKINLHEASDTLAAGAVLAKGMPPGVVVYLYGELGAGKTTFMRGVLQGLGYTGKVKSPTYTLVEPYDLSPVVLYHFDLYRLRSPDELATLGMNDYADGVAACWIEWPEKGEGYLPPPDLVCHLHYHGEERLLVMTAITAKAAAWLSLG